MDQPTSPPLDNSIGPKSLCILTPIFALGILFYILRIYTRVVPIYKLKASDYASTIAVLTGTITYILFAVAIANGFGRHSVYVTPESSVKILQCLYGTILTGVWASVFARISVACMLLEFTTSTTWRVVLWISIICQAASLISTEVVQLVQCQPIHAFWEKVPGGGCFSSSVASTIGHICTGTGIVGDLIFAIMPMFLIWRLSRSVVERCLISLLMTLGLFATGAGVSKIIYSNTYDKTSPDGFREMMPVFLWCRMEELLLIVGSSAPLLKAPVGHALQRLGLPKFQQKTKKLNFIHSFRLSATRHWHNPQNQQKLEDRPTSRQVIRTDESKLQAGEYNSPGASAPGDVSGAIDARKMSVAHSSSSALERQ